jgi:hypothetical protein
VTKLSNLALLVPFRRFHQPIQPSAPAEQRPPLQPLYADVVLTRALAITGLDEAAILAVRRGPGGNPAKRFLIWALWRGALLTHVAIGRRLGMTGGHVGRVLSRLRQGQLAEPITAWQAAWRTLERPPQG